MLNSKSQNLKSAGLLSLFMVVMLNFFVSCMPSSTAPGVQGSNSTNTTGGSNGTGSNYGEPTFPVSGIFIQEGATQTTSQFSLPLNFSDSFMVRGQALSSYLRTLPNTTRFCLVGKYNLTSGTKFLIMSGKPKSYTDLVKKTTEFYLYVEPANDTSNQNDCLTYNLTNTIFNGVTSPGASFSLTQLCSTCNSTVTSEGLKLYFNNGEAVPTLNLSMLNLSISGSISSGGNTCVESTACKARGYDCCLDGQCINDGAVRPDAILKPGFEQAQLDVASNPNRFVAYPQFYFVCATRPEGDGEEDIDEPVDPNYEAAIRLMEMKQLFQCLNKVDGEFSYCTIKYSQASLKIQAGTSFSPSSQGYFEDINFSSLNPAFGVGDYANNITKIFYGGQTLYEANKTPLLAADGLIATTEANDDLTTAQSVKITKTLPANALDDNLYLTFRVDGTCEKLGTSLARCTKTYVHAQTSTPVPSTYDHDSSSVYLLPSYADTSSSSNIIVKVSGIVVPEDPTTWTKHQSPNRIQFAQTLYPNQTIEITYYVTSSANVANLVKARTAAQTQVNSMCTCGSSVKCNIKPVYSADNIITNYECVYPGPSNDSPPTNQTVYVSNKNVPHRYYDIGGVNFDESYASAGDQEGVAFSYTSNNILKPSNLITYTGFNEIYGSFSKTNSSAPKPAKMVKVKKDTIYDLFTNSGVFSTCLTCGSDYYNSLQKIFPQSFTGVGGGYIPDMFTSSRMGNTGLYRSDDILFGRACFIPATMLPWSHNAGTSVKAQRTNRLAAQHALFANGYNRDWFGFDYGSLVGSFDGVTWFSIGNKRRIKATSNRLFLAVNSYYGDQSVDSNFNVTVSETTAYSPAMPDHDTETDGAECQKAHFCSNDNDCFRQLGYDYSCQNISSITTKWPQYDANGIEVIGSATKTIASIVGGSNGQSKRCVYRGRGAPCHQDLTSLGTTFNSTTTPGTLACSNNNYCQNINTGNNSRFNDRIARFANTPAAQNSANAAAPSPLSDIVGMGARILGRPFEYYGNTTIQSASKPGLAANNVMALCVPGKNLTASVKTYDLNISSPTTHAGSADKIFGIGPTMSGLQSPKYLNACPATDSLGISIQHYDLSLGDTTSINVVTTAQNLSTNLLDLTATSAVFSPTSGTQITGIGYQKNACLRAPGASCFSDMDCAPSEFIASKVKAANLTGVLNPAEEKYWEEELICGNPEFKYLQTGVLNTATYNIKNNVCCRDFGKTFTVFTQDDTSSYEWCDSTPGAEKIKVAGVNTNINSYSRYSRVHTGYDKMTCNISDVSSTKSFALSLKVANSTPALSAAQAFNRYLQQGSQYKTLDMINQRTCCTKHWVRNFAPTNGGGHRWGANKLQVIDKDKFKTLNWVATVTGIGNVDEYACDPDGYNNPTCEIKDFTAAETELYLNFFGGYELTGIPQVALMTEDHVKKLNNGVDGGPDYSNSPPGDLAEPAWFGTSFYENKDFRDSNNKKLYSAATTTGLKSTTKKVFSDSEFSCCIPSGQQVPDGTTADQCCTGYVANQGSSNLLRCCLPDYTDLTVYLSRYVSSEGRGYPDSAYDPNTGYIKDPAVVETLAAQKNLCCSGEYVRGVAIRKLPIPMGNGSWVNQPDAFTKRFVYLSSAEDNNSTVGPIGSIFDAGVRWNNHVYCVPKGFKAQIPAEQ